MVALPSGYFPSRPARVRGFLFSTALLLLFALFLNVSLLGLPSSALAEVSQPSASSSGGKDLTSLIERIEISVIVDGETDYIIKYRSGDDALVRIGVTYTEESQDWIYAPGVWLAKAGVITEIPIKIRGIGLDLGTYTAVLEIQRYNDGHPFKRIPVFLTVKDWSPSNNEIYLYFDEAGTDCDREASPGEVVPLYVLAYPTEFTMSAAEFRLALPPGIRYLDESYGPEVMVWNGDLPSGLQVAIRPCRDGLIHLVTAYLMVEESVLGAELRLEPHPVSSFFGFADCTYFRIRRASTTNRAVLNGACLTRVATRPATWGAIKSLYTGREDG